MVGRGDTGRGGNVECSVIVVATFHILRLTYSSPPPSPCKAALKTWFISIENTARAVHHRIDPSY